MALKVPPGTTGLDFWNSATGGTIPPTIQPDGTVETFPMPADGQFDKDVYLSALGAFSPTLLTLVAIDGAARLATAAVAFNPASPTVKLVARSGRGEGEHQPVKLG